MPTQDTLVIERFFDEAGDMHIVLHSPFGSRLNRRLREELGYTYGARCSFDPRRAPGPFTANAAVSMFAQHTTGEGFHVSIFAK